MIHTLALLLMTTATHAAEPSFQYPELVVVPRASERIQTEAARESKKTWQNHIPLLVPATMNFASGLTLQLSGTKAKTDPTNDGAKYAPWVGMGVGAAWWVVTLGILDRAEMYAATAREISAMPAQTQREQLLRERRAEEAIQSAGRLARRLKYISVISNAMTSAYMISSAQSKEFSKYLAIGAAASAITPMLFPHRWEIVDRTQKDYKKRIYGPIADLGIQPDSTGKNFAPVLTVALRF